MATAAVGSTARGERRRAALVEAAAAVLAERGFAALSHRAVAAQAGLPLAATTYYFASREELVEAALGVLGEGYLEHAREVADGVPARRTSPRRLAETLVSMVAGPDPDAERLLVFYERYAEAGRSPGLRPVAASWTNELVDLVARTLRRVGYPSTAGVARIVVASIDGLLLARLVEGADEPLAAVERDVADLLSRLRSGA